MNELTDNDKQRIEQAAKLAWKNTITAFEDSDEISFWEGYLTGAEYTTLYERQKFAGYTVNSYKSKVIKELEAERSELRNKVIEECIELLEEKGFGVDENDDSYERYNSAQIFRLLNSLKTK